MDTTEKIIAHFLNQIDNKDFDLSHVRKVLEKENYPESEIREVIKELDNALQLRAFEKSNRSNADNLIIVGVVLTVFGLVVTVGTFTGLIPSGNSFLLAYGPILGGISISVSAYMSKKKKGPKNRKFIKRSP
ncbi:hypothetical protein [Algoriphagus formosus]|uniref:hypothetical protein n=1 Tax=Algoriphagus formosus TaxID=2007308 RepID=UPI003F70E815